MEITIIAIDVGSPKQNAVGWVETNEAGDEISQGPSLKSAVTAIEKNLKAGTPVALGFEAPLWMPLPEIEKDAGDIKGLSSGRQDEGSRSMFAPAGGTSVTMMAFQQVAWIFSKLETKDVEITTDAKRWFQSPKGILIWEAFVSGENHTKVGDHVADAKTAAAGFAQSFAEKDSSSAFELREKDKEKGLNLALLAVMGALEASNQEFLKHPGLEVLQGLKKLPMVVKPVAKQTKS